MCGISGFLTAAGAPPTSELEARLWTMIATMRHRGPDDEGVWTDGRAGLAHARLSILARDRLGKKPLYYAACSDALLFGSEIKALLAWPEMHRTPDLAAIDRYLSFGYVPGPDTAFVGIRKLPAAHYLVAETSPDGSLGEAKLVRYWSLPEIGGSRRHRPAEEL